MYEFIRTNSHKHCDENVKTSNDSYARGREENAFYGAKSRTKTIEVRENFKYYGEMNLAKNHKTYKTHIFVLLLVERIFKIRTLHNFFSGLPADYPTTE
jgi:hypothetical protein